MHKELPIRNKKIRVCHVAVGDLWAGAEVQLKSLISELARIPEFDLSVILFNGGRLAEEISRLGVPVSVFPETKWRATGIVRALWRYFSNTRLDIVHTHKYKDTILAAPIARWAGVPHVVRSVHGLTEPFFGIQAWRMGFYECVERRIQERYVGTIVAVSSDIERRLRDRAVRSKVVCIRNGIQMNAAPTELSRSRIRQAFNVSDETYVIGAVGRLTPVKGLVHLIKAVKILVEQGLDVSLWLVGDGVLKGELRRLAAECGIGARVEIMGHREDTHALMQAMDIFILPSLSEGIPMALLEAMATSLPVIASRVGGIPEVIEDGMTGLLMEPGDPEGLASMCGRLMQDEAFSKRLGQAARESVKRFSSTTMAARVAGLYRELVPESPRPLMDRVPYS